MNVYVTFFLLFAVFCCLMVAIGLLMLVTDLLGWTCFWITEPYNDRQWRKWCERVRDRSIDL
jgi:hypothetical protein